MEYEESCGVYIPTHKRAGSILPTLQAAISAVKGKAPIYLVMDYDQIETYRKAIPEELYDDFRILVVIPSGRRISYAMTQVLKFAKDEKQKYIIRIDDDKCPAENIMDLLKPLKENPDIGWVGAYFSFYNLLKIQPNTGTFATFSMGCTINAIDVEKAVTAGGFDEEMIVKEDDDMKVRLLEKGYYITINSDVVCKSLGNRGEEGGVSSFPIPDEVALMNHFNKVHGGNFSSLRKGKMYVKWAVMLKRGKFPGIDPKRVSERIIPFERRNK